ncbi:MAG TPA: ribonuclease J [Fimbriimonadaceae bacterium]|nr:ribonuclease J [Fimbriimonadaceae bacterium]
MALVEVFALGGVGEIGKNCYVVRQDDDIIVIDCGLAFPNEEMPGVDIVIPDFTYLLENSDKVRGVFLTHAHEDHVGSLPYLLNQLEVPVYATEFTHALIRSKLEEKTDFRSLTLKTFAPGDIIQVGALSVEPVRVTHSIPDTCAMAVRTQHGIVLFTSDFKFDFTPVDGKLTNMARLGELGKEGVLVLLSDSTNIERPGWGPTESAVSDGLRHVMTHAPGRVMLTTFASNIHRMQQVYTVAAEVGRKVAVVGRRMEQNIEICSRMGYLQIPKGVRINLDEMQFYKPEQLMILTTGSQGEPMSALVQMSKGEYGRLQVREGDTVIYSARPIPGNEAAIWRTINRLFRQGATVVYDSQSPIHVSGHAYREELKMMINLTRPFYLAPVHGEPRHQHLYRQMGLDMGFPDHRIFTLNDGIPLCLDDTKAYLGEQQPCGRVLVDTSGATGVPDDVLRDRTNVARDGVIVVTVAIDPERGELVGQPSIQFRGVHAEDGALDDTIEVVEDALRALDVNDLRDVDKVRHLVSDTIRRFVHKRASVRPLVLPTIIEV